MEKLLQLIFEKVGLVSKRSRSLAFSPPISLRSGLNKVSSYRFYLVTRSRLIHAVASLRRSCRGGHAPERSRKLQDLLQDPPKRNFHPRLYLFQTKPADLADQTDFRTSGTRSSSWYPTGTQPLPHSSRTQPILARSSLLSDSGNLHLYKEVSIIRN